MSQDRQARHTMGNSGVPRWLLLDPFVGWSMVLFEFALAVRAFASMKPSLSSGNETSIGARSQTLQR
jgi:hypothetical protein